MVGISSSLVGLAAFCWGVSGGLGALLIAGGWDAFVVSFYRGAIGLFFVLGWLAFNHRHANLGSRRLWIWSAVAGLGVAGNFAFYFISIAEGRVAIAATLMYCAPVFVLLVSFALKLEKPTLGKLVALVIILLGILLLTQVYDLNASAVSLVGLVAGLLSGVSYALCIFAFKYASFYGSSASSLSIALLVLLLVLFWPADKNQLVIALHSSYWVVFLGLGILGGGLSFMIYILGLRATAPAVAAMLAMVEPVTASLFGVWVLDESLATQQLIGMGMILLAVTGLSVTSSS
ncbi:DMT family transporter [Marinospirillum perlucidum]|uniref:DMT family transporter n=1 Tax=Marinospirillum perlucidum TaxID=1982602 RepID=UPI000DF49956|nr:DMT family transporter [Marinospirillum perlucidum]